MIIRVAHDLDARGMADLLGRIIAIGGTTALTEMVTADDIREWMRRSPGHSAWHVAEGEDGAILGFQWIEPADHLPSDAANIATFVVPGAQGMGIGSALFRATERAARRLGFGWINANIRADNAGGLTYYQSRGFETYGTRSGHVMGDGHVVDKVLKRYSLS